MFSVPQSWPASSHSRTLGINRKDVTATSITDEPVAHWYVSSRWPHDDTASGVSYATEVSPLVDSRRLARAESYSYVLHSPLDHRSADLKSIGNSALHYTAGKA